MNAMSMIDERRYCPSCRADRHDQCTHRGCACAVDARWLALKGKSVNHTNHSLHAAAAHPHPGAKRLQPVA
jgi:hypothetical protein